MTTATLKELPNSNEEVRAQSKLKAGCTTHRAAPMPLGPHLLRRASPLAAIRAPAWRTPLRPRLTPSARDAAGAARAAQPHPTPHTCRPAEAPPAAAPPAPAAARPAAPAGERNRGGAGGVQGHREGVQQAVTSVPHTQTHGHTGEGATCAPPRHEASAQCARVPACSGVACPPEAPRCRHACRRPAACACGDDAITTSTGGRLTSSGRSHGRRPSCSVSPAGSHPPLPATPATTHAPARELRHQQPIRQCSRPQRLCTHLDCLRHQCIPLAAPGRLHLRPPARHSLRVPCEASIAAAALPRAQWQRPRRRMLPAPRPAACWPARPRQRAPAGR